MLQGEKGKEMRINAKEWKRKAREASKVGGSSYNNFQRFKKEALLSGDKTLRNEGLSLSISVIELLLPELPDLPSDLHSTNGLAVHLMPILKQAFDMSSPKFMKLLKNLSPDLLIYDIIQPWAPTAASSLGIPRVVFIIRSSSIVLIKSFNEIECKYVDHLSLLTDKKIVRVGPFVADPYCPDTEQNTMIIEWLGTKATGSIVFVSFGSECFLFSADLEEIAS
ncbi:beta-D-glucosyl crocetin beta-1,6-glucosyltransferase [Artemisia annua]|uniref:Beta-D-glucosyl crocetin beta-1,6-glucosyltransferase n=1 Tax=Artemisia annua TaxID=35608 RepID=A0A2U1P967_ARTAN|nr:beta-D-glucosyl crocetin beta-1,6-glucosyltransferase [Artemisia annua]